MKFIRRLLFVVVSMSFIATLAITHNASFRTNTTRHIKPLITVLKRAGQNQCRAECLPLHDTVFFRSVKNGLHTSLAIVSRPPIELIGNFTIIFSVFVWIRVPMMKRWSCSQLQALNCVWLN